MSIWRGVPLLLLMACGGLPPLGDNTEEATLLEQLERVQGVACLRPAKAASCDPSLRVSFSPSRQSSWATDGKIEDARKSGAVFCDGGRPQARFASFEQPNEELTGELPQPVWEAIWRVLDSTDSCASAYDAAVQVGRRGATSSCADPRPPKTKE